MPKRLDRAGIGSQCRHGCCKRCPHLCRKSTRCVSLATQRARACRRMPRACASAADANSSAPPAASRSSAIFCCSARVSSPTRRSWQSLAPAPWIWAAGSCACTVRSKSPCPTRATRHAALRRQAAVWRLRLLPRQEARMVPSWPATNRGILNTTLAARLGQVPNVYAIGDVADAFGALNAGVPGVEHGRCGNGQHSARHQRQERHVGRCADGRLPAAVNMLKVSWVWARWSSKAPSWPMIRPRRADQPERYGDLDDMPNNKIDRLDVNGRIPGRPENHHQARPQRPRRREASGRSWQADQSDMHKLIFFPFDILHL